MIEFTEEDREAVKEASGSLASLDNQRAAFLAGLLAGLARRHESHATSARPQVEQTTRTFRSTRSMRKELEKMQRAGWRVGAQSETPVTRAPIITLEREQA